MFADLHLHTTFSDGTDTPLEICNLAKGHGVNVISITDHDTVDGHKALKTEELPEGLTLIPGIEISTEVNKTMLHTLGYYIDIYDKRLEEFIKAISKEKTETTMLNFEHACANNIFSYTWERVLELNPGQQRIGGIQVVKAMKIDGYEVPGMSLWEMFQKCFWPANDTYITTQTFTGYDAIDIIKKTGGIPVIAHPKNIGNDEIVLDLIRYGAQGLEVYHPIHNDDDVAKYLQMAEREGLYISGGTDWHGKNNRKEISGFGMCGLKDGGYPILSAIPNHRRFQ